MTPLISIIMPVYNLEKYVGESISSVQDQTVVDWELIVINDGSTDQTEALVHSFAEGDSRIRCYSRPKSGVSMARNYGLDVAQGQYITFLDGDDLWNPRFLEKCLECLSQERGDFVVTLFNRLMPDGTLKSVPAGVRPDSGSEKVILRFLNREMKLIMGQFIAAKALLQNELRFTQDCRFGEDTEFILKLLANSEKTCFIDEELLSYRQRFASATKQRWDWTVRIDAVHALERSDAYIQAHYKGSKRDEILRLSRRMLEYERYRFQYRLIKYGCYREAEKLLDHEEWVSALRFVIRDGRFLDELKAKIVFSENKLAWHCLTGFYSALHKLNGTAQSQKPRMAS